MHATTYRSAEILFRAASAMQLAAQSLRALAERLEAWLDNRRAARRALREFSSMSDRELKDIGLTRSDTERVALSPAHDWHALELPAGTMRERRGDTDAGLARSGFWLQAGFAGAAMLGAALVQIVGAEARSLAGWALACAGAALMAAGSRRTTRMLDESRAGSPRDAVESARSAPATVRRRAINGPAVPGLGLRTRVGPGAR